MRSSHSGPAKPVIILDLDTLACLMDGQTVELDNAVIAPDKVMLEAHEHATFMRERRLPEPDFHL